MIRSLTLQAAKLNIHTAAVYESCLLEVEEEEAGRLCSLLSYFPYEYIMRELHIYIEITNVIQELCFPTKMYIFRRLLVLKGEKSVQNLHWLVPILVLKMSLSTPPAALATSTIDIYT